MRTHCTEFHFVFFNLEKNLLIWLKKNKQYEKEKGRHREIAKREREWNNDKKVIQGVKEIFVKLEEKGKRMKVRTRDYFLKEWTVDESEWDMRYVPNQKYGGNKFY